MNSLALPSLLLIVPVFAMAKADSLLDALQGSHRVLILFAPTAGDPQLAEQRRRLGDHAAALRERDVTVIEVIGSAVRRDGHVIEADAAAIRQRQKVDASAFAVHLIGKDGGTKLRREVPIGIEEINNLIDSMPMRKEEIRERR
ncbi:MAG TPA: DUF4174 domain-containing protein [Tepidisphaeraceae bacterium]|jgi:hypothetical protein